MEEKIGQARRIIRETARKYDITEKDILSREKLRLFSDARTETIDRLHHELGLSYRSIAYLMNRRNVSTILYHLTRKKSKKIEKKA